MNAVIAPLFPRKPVKLLVLTVVLLGSGIGLQFAGPLITDSLDFRAFYCAASAAASDRDPYLAEPLRSCEQAAMRQAGAVPLPFLTLPAPLPGYALAAFLPFTWLPYPMASAAYSWLLILALAATAVLLRYSTAIGMPAIVAAVLFSGGWLSLENGQLAPMLLALLCASAVALARGWIASAALCASGTMLEPHLGLPVCICLALTVSKTRPTLAACAGVLALTSLLFLGPQHNVEYFTRTLPEHALAESATIGQFSVTALLTHLGLVQGAALTVGNAWYAVMVVLGCVIARRVTAATGAREFIVTIPAACVLFGGPFIHLSQMVTAIPALLLLSRYAPERRSVLAVAVVLIAIPWQEFAVNSPLVVCLASGAVSWTVGRALLQRAEAANALALFAIGLAGVESCIRITFPRTHGGDVVVAMAAVSGDAASADATWSVYEHVAQSSMTPWYLATHLPTWAGLALLLTVALQTAGAHICACPAAQATSRRRALKT